MWNASRLTQRRKRKKSSVCVNRETCWIKVSEPRASLSLYRGIVYGRKLLVLAMPCTVISVFVVSVLYHGLHNYLCMPEQTFFRKIKMTISNHQTDCPCWSASRKRSKWLSPITKLTALVDLQVVRRVRYLSWCGVSLQKPSYINIQLHATLSP